MVEISLDFHCHLPKEMDTCRDDPSVSQSILGRLWEIKLSVGPTVDENHLAPLGNRGTPLFVAVYTGIDSFQGFLGAATWILQPSTVC